MAALDDVLAMCADLGFPVGSGPHVFHRTYAGPFYRRDASAWSWFVTGNGFDIIGSVYSVRKLLHAHKQQRVFVDYPRFDNGRKPELEIYEHPA